MVDTITPALARQIALTAQGFGQPHPASPDGQAVAGVVDRLGVLQIDSVNVFERSHYLPVFSRIGAYPHTILDAITGAPASAVRAPNAPTTTDRPTTSTPTTTTEEGLIEYWAHQAAFIPRRLWPLFEFRREEYRRKGSGEGGWLSANPPLADWLCHELRSHGPLQASAIEHDANARTGAWWGWSEVKRTLEWMFRTGDVVCVERRRFERVYALPEQTLPGSLLHTAPPRDDSIRELVLIAASALGIATEADLADYWRLTRAPVAVAIRDLEENGSLIRVQVPGWETRSWTTPAWMHRDAVVPGHIAATALLSPFDPVVWCRPRTERVFGFHYRIEIYVPKPQRIFGYYSLPILIDDRLVGRVDLKSDRAARVLRVQSAWTEKDAPPDTAERLIPVLRQAAAWQGLAEIVSTGAGNLGLPLKSEINRPA
ncbi:MAG: hypothetical protein B5766_09875 [Candidatus Lumbricidophila eiseniae]|uniref:Cytoplasmic protein n=1 Tax=Candidatus Lumbricidiphila eiseniae TaxID=1969409 RepID=A0A2A6FPV2_9MICO|nr:MAG: hypothetical protein B5766_09875 [Candidatus Lumbricidophila eiseniae]